MVPFTAVPKGKITPVLGEWATETELSQLPNTQLLMEIYFYYTLWILSFRKYWTRNSLTLDLKGSHLISLQLFKKR
jgi:hypothetical protein